MEMKFLPRVRVNVTEIVNQINTPVTYTPAFILRTPTGPIGERNYYRTYNDFISAYGDPSEYKTSDFPVFYAIGEYLKEYQGIYITRLASDDASYGEIDGGCILLKDANGVVIEDSGESVKLVSVKTNYKTSIYNGLEASIRIDNISNVIYGAITVDGTAYETTRYRVDFATLTNVQFDNILDNLVNSFNSLDLGLTMKKEYTSAYTIVPLEDNIMSGIIVGGNSGSNTVDNDTVKEAIHLYDSVEVTIDSITFPEFENLETINYATQVAENRMFFVLSTAYLKEVYNNEVVALCDEAIDYVVGDEFEFFVDDVRYTGTVEDNTVLPYVITTNYPTSSIENHSGSYPTTILREGTGSGLQVMINTSKVENPKPTVGELQSLVSEYPTSKALVVYLDKVHYIEGHYTNPLTGDEKYIDIPASIAVQHAYAKSYLSGPYRAPAGINRATLPLIKELRCDFSDSDLVALDNYMIPINPIVYKPSYGYVVWDEKTTANEKSNPYSRYVNGAALVNYIVKNVDMISQRYLFEPIVATTFANWELEVRNLLEPLVNENVILPNYDVNMNSTNNNAETISKNQLFGNIKVQKVGVAREIIIDLEVSNQVEE